MSESLYAPIPIWSDEDRRFFKRCDAVRAERPDFSDEQIVIHLSPYFPGLALLKLKADERAESRRTRRFVSEFADGGGVIDYTDVPT